MIEARELRGTIQAIKLTGDPNVPRGEYSWIANLDRKEGLLRCARLNQEPECNVVRSWGHIADTGFSSGEFASHGVQS